MASNWASGSVAGAGMRWPNATTSAPPLAVCSAALSCAVACRTTMQRIGRIARARFIMWANLFSSA